MTSKAIATFSVAQALRKEVLQTPISNTVWGALMRGEFDVAVFQAMKAVEVAVHEAMGKPGNLRGTDLVGVSRRRRFADGSQRGEG